MGTRPESEIASAAFTLKRMAADGLRLFPLRHWDATRISPKTGEEERVGKHPRDAGYQLHDYSGFNFANYLKRKGNIGAAPGAEDLIVDVDPERGGLKSLERLLWDADAELPLDLFPRVMSGKGDGGFHVYMKHPRDYRTRWQMKAFPGLDFQAFGRYVVAPGSLHPKTGKPYTLLRPWARPAMAPPSLLSIIAKPEHVSSGGVAGALTLDDLRSLLGALDAADFGAGGRNHEEWLDIAMAVHHGSGGDDEAAEIWLDWCASDEQYGDAAREMNMRRWESFDATLDSSMSETVTYKTLLQAVVRAGHATLVARLHHADAANDFEDDDLDVERLASLGISTKRARS